MFKNEKNTSISSSFLIITFLLDCAKLNILQAKCVMSLCVIS